MKQNYVTMRKTTDDNIVKQISLLILKISFLTLFGCGVKITPDIFECRVKISPDIDPIYGLMKLS